jgi:hypothetical protein
MSDLFDQAPRSTVEHEAKRITFAAARAAEHAARELSLLVRATQARDDINAHELEFEADAAYRDFIAMREEHGLDD